MVASSAALGTVWLLTLKYIIHRIARRQMGRERLETVCEDLQSHEQREGCDLCELLQFLSR